MNHRISRKVWDVLACSNCRSALNETHAGARCPDCGCEFAYTANGALDMRLQRPRKCVLEFELGDAMLSDDTFQFEPLALNACPEVNFEKESGPWNLPKEIMSYFPRAIPPGSLMLDLGCGHAIHKRACEHAGFEWVGLDYASLEAPIMGDAHALPFRENSYGFILSIAVLEHIRFPLVVMKEAYRVLKPGGRFIGTVAFLEPFHGDSYYHHTHLGIHNSLQYGGFQIEKIAPSATWSGLKAQSSMALFPHMPVALTRCMVLPLELLHRLWWIVGSIVTHEANRNTRLTNTTGCFTFVATKRVPEYD